MAAAMAALAEPDWSPLGYMAQGINNDPLKLRAMLKRLRLPGYDDPAGVELGVPREIHRFVMPGVINLSCGMTRISHI